MKSSDEATKGGKRQRADPSSLRHFPPSVASSSLRWGEFWTPAQRPVVGALIALILILAATRWWNRPRFVPDPSPDAGPRSAQLLSRIDPNSASWQRLAVLPGIGEKRAKTIVAYRNAFRAAHDGAPAFGHPEDLAHVHGIGLATVQSLRPYLRFPAESADHLP
jgi:hypothetical protein